MVGVGAAVEAVVRRLAAGWLECLLRMTPMHLPGRFRSCLSFGSLGQAESGP